jgi:4-hydroxy-tetrahydrodipicolinate synthase
MGPTRFISAICTPLTEDEDLHEEGLAAHIEDQARAGIPSLFVAGSMGRMQLLRDATFRGLIRRAVELGKGRFELLAGAGDTSFARTQDRIRFLNDFPLDGVVVLTPYLFPFSQEELADYFRALADVSQAPLYLYDLPQVTGTKIALETVLAVARHPNITGIKCSDEPGYARQLQDLVGEAFRVIIAQPDLTDVFIRHGFRDHLDGMYAVAPHWAMAIARHAASGQWKEAARYQEMLSGLKRILLQYGVAAFTAVLNAHGIPGHMAPRPTRPLTDEQKERLLDEPMVCQFVRGYTAAA